jgi:hypothetical protein
MEKTKQKDVLKFDKSSEIDSFLQYTLRLQKRMGKSFDYIFETLKNNKLHSDFSKKKKFDLSKVKFDEGKSYNWFAITYKNVRLVVRQYGTHLTIFTCLVSDEGRYFNNYSAITFNTKSELLSDRESDLRCDQPFLDINECLPKLFELVQEENEHSFWNELSFPRPKHCEVKIAFYSDRVYSIDLSVYCAEELSNIHLKLFAENDMFKKLSELKVGEKINCFGEKEILRIDTELEDDYYHGVGVMIDDDGREKFEDVYSLTSWYFDSIFK